MSERVRIARYLASCGLGSRRGCEELINQGRVKVNDSQVASLGLSVDPRTDVVTVDGKIAEPRELVYYLLNKPVGFTTTRADRFAARVITELVADDPPVWPVGRLDRETSGLIILTNDGELTERLTHPSYQKEKEYLVTTESPLTKDEITMIRRGVTLEDGMIVPDAFERVGDKTYRIIVHEGRKRLIRRIIAHIRANLVKLERIRIGSLVLGDVAPGDWRPLTSEEKELLLTAHRSPLTRGDK